jgi:hypothetical protein
MKMHESLATPSISQRESIEFGFSLGPSVPVQSLLVNFTAEFLLTSAVGEVSIVHAAP